MFRCGELVGRALRPLLVPLGWFVLDLPYHLRCFRAGFAKGLWERDG